MQKAPHSIDNAKAIDRPLLNKRLVENNRDEDSSSLEEWKHPDAALDALPPVDEKVEVGQVNGSLMSSSS